MQKIITIKDIAESLNLSRNTVSKAINGQYVPEKTRKRILDKAKELNYKSSIIKYTNNKMNKRYRILLLSGKPLNNIRFFLPIIREIENYCFSNDHELFQFTYNPNLSSFDVLQEYINGLQIDGIIAIETFDNNLINRLINLNKPISFIDFSTTMQKGNFDIIETSNFQPFYDLTYHIASKYNLKHFTYVGDEEHCLSFQKRYFGMLCALNKLNIKHAKEDDILKNDLFDYGNIDLLRAAVNQLKYRTECFICSNDFIARSICKVLESLKIKVPEECLVIGYDNVGESISSYPKITTVGSDTNLIGATAIKTLVSRIENPNTQTIIYTINSSIIERESTNKEKIKDNKNILK